MKYLGQLTALLAILVLCFTQASARSVSEIISERRVATSRSNARKIASSLQKLSGRSLKQAVFYNPVFQDCPDPAIYSDFVNRYYYLTCTRQTYVNVWRSKDPSQWSEGANVRVFTASSDPNSLLSTEVWAPEIHNAYGQWTVYFTSRNANDVNSHKIFVSTNANPDPFAGSWSAPAQVQIPTDPWAIDPSIFSLHNIYYFLFTGYTTPGVPASGSGVYIAPMSSITTLTQQATIISVPTFLFARFAGDNSTTAAVNEGPHFWSHDSVQFITFSASDCSSDNYALGLLYRNIADDPTTGGTSGWTKYPDPVLYKNTTGGVYATGHNGFFKDVNGCNDWIVFHANPQPNQGCGDFRAAHIQPFGYNASNGLPSFGGPAKGRDEPIPKPGVFT